MPLPSDFIPVNTPLFGGREEEFLVDCIRSGWVSSEGAYVAKFEQSFAERVGRKHGIAVTNGTTALEMAVAALGIGPGDEVILPTFTIISCAYAIVRAGATPVVVDCDPDTWCMDVGQIEQKITPRTKAIMPVHIYGLPVDMAPLLALAKARGLAIIEDAAEAHGLDYDGRPCGGFGALSTFSFYPNKLITTGEGGMVVTDDAELAARCRDLRNLCFGRERRFQHEQLSSNYRMTNLQAALGLAQLEQMDGFLARKRRMGKRYGELLKGVPGAHLPLPKTPHAENAYWVFGLVLDDAAPFDADEAMKRLAGFGIGTRPFFWPMHEQPALWKLGFLKGERHPVAERIARRGFYIPSGLGLSEDQIERVSASVREVLS